MEPDCSWQTPGARFFQSLDWLEAYWQPLAPTSVCGCLVYAADEPVGILPLVVAANGCGRAACGVLTYPLDDWGSFYGPIGPEPTATLIAGLGHVRRTDVDWDLIELPWVDAARDRRPHRPSPGH